MSAPTTNIASPARASSRSSGRSRAERPAFSKGYWRAAAVSRGRGRCARAPASAIPAPRRAATPMSVEPNVASIDYMGDRLTFFDCPGSIEFIHDMRYALPVCDAAIVVCEADRAKVPALQVILRELEELGVPRILFLNKIDQATERLRETLEMLQPASRTPLLLRQIPVWENGVATGFIDLALERAFVYREHAPSTVIEMPAGEIPEEKQARYSMLEKLADYDDALMEQLISDIEPPQRPRFRRSGARIARGSCRAGADGLGDRRPWRDAASESRAARGAGDRARRASAWRSTTRARRSPRSSAPSTPRMAASCRCRACPARRLRRRRDRRQFARRRGAHRRPGAADGRDVFEEFRAPRRATPSPSPGSKGSRPATASADGKVAPAAAEAPPPPPPTQAFAIHVKDRKDEVRLAARARQAMRGGSRRSPSCRTPKCPR